MLKEKMKVLQDFFKKHYIIILPVVIVIVAAITVVIALNAHSAKEREKQLEESVASLESEVVESVIPAEDVPMLSNDDNEIDRIVNAYYEAMGNGDMASLQTLCDEVSENDQLYYTELSNYIDKYSDIEVYSKQGPIEGSVITYVYFKMELTDHGAVPGYETLYICSKEDGSKFIKNESNFSDAEKEYIITLNEQVDVVEFNNRVAVEYNELMASSPELLEYCGLLGEQVKASVGEILAAKHAVETEESEPEESEPGETTTTGSNPDAEPEKQYCKAVATVNVRSSDSEKADKLGKAQKGQRLEVLEVRVNGWTKILFDGKEGYIRSDLLRMEEQASAYETIGKVTATTNINVRAAASEDADRLGMLTAGDSLELIANEDGWCKVKYNKSVGYVKAEYVTQE